MDSQKCLKRKSQDIAADNCQSNTSSLTLTSDSTDDDLKSLVEWIVDAIETNSSVIDRVIESIAEPTCAHNLDRSGSDLQIESQVKEEVRSVNEDSFCSIELNEDFWEEFNSDMTPTQSPSEPKSLTFKQTFQNLLNQLMASPSSTPKTDSGVALPSPPQDFTLPAVRLLAELDSIKCLNRFNTFLVTILIVFSSSDSLISLKSKLLNRR